jgi:hypothetical protein
MKRYISHSGATRHDLQKFRHVRLLGKLSKVVGYRYQSRRKFNDAGEKYLATHEAVKVIGENGYCRFDALCWGYGGEGPRGLVDLLVVCGLSHEDAVKVSQMPRLDKPGIDWEINLPYIGLILHRNRE